YNSVLIKNLSFFKEFGKEFNAAIILLGAFFGYKKFYDLYYDKLNLRFYKSYNPKQEKFQEQRIQLPAIGEENIKGESEVEQPGFQIEIVESSNIPKNKILKCSISENLPSEVKRN